jgi:hypothetical protein
MKITIECEVLTYDELQKGHQLILHHREMNAIAELWEPDFLIDEFKEELEAIGFCGAVVHYSGFGNQGDGCCFDADVDLEKVCKHLGIEYVPEVDDWVCEIETINHRYLHERTRRIIFRAAGGLLSEGVSEKANWAGVKIEELRLRLCREFYRKLIKDRDEEMAEENLLSNLRSRRYVYRLDVEKKLVSQLDEEVVLV